MMIKLFSLLAPLALLSPLAPAPLAPLAPLAPSRATPLAQFDHLVVAARSLDEGVAEFERLTGVKAGVGGKHPGRGTENALVSFGGGKYLEIIGRRPSRPSPRETRGC